uniref:Uncharacterized protein n=1 Tax=Glossina pallidipes TaxID=7398 RepID=A0A1B0ACQ4_GLOPL
MRGDINMDGNKGIVEEESSRKNDSTKKGHQSINHPIAQTLDISILAVFSFLKKRSSSKSSEKETLSDSLKFLQILIKAFNAVILPIQIRIMSNFYLRNKVTNPNCPALIRQASVGYLSSFLARSAFIHANRDLTVDKKTILFLQSLQLTALMTSDYKPLRVCLPAVATAFARVTRFYVERQFPFFYNVVSSGNADCVGGHSHVGNGSTGDCVGGHSHVAIAVLATASAVMSAVMSAPSTPSPTPANINSLRTYQLAYCHAVLERNARRKLATIYANDTATPEEILDRFFPFDPYLLKLGKSIQPPHIQSWKLSDNRDQSSLYFRNTFSIFAILTSECKQCLACLQQMSKIMSAYDEEPHVLHLPNGEWQQLAEIIMKAIESSNNDYENEFRFKVQVQILLQSFWKTCSYAVLSSVYQTSLEKRTSTDMKLITVNCKSSLVQSTLHLQLKVFTDLNSVLLLNVKISGSPIIICQHILVSPARRNHLQMPPILNVLESTCRFRKLAKNKSQSFVQLAQISNNFKMPTAKK